MHDKLFIRRKIGLAVDVCPSRSSEIIVIECGFASIVE